MTSPAAPELSSFPDLIGDPAVVTQLRRVAPGPFTVAAEFWRVPMASSHLPPRMKELLLLAMHASATSLNVDAINRHIRRARSAGATAQEVVDVLVTITALANHSLYSSVPILEEELAAAGRPVANDDMSDDILEAAKERFTEARGFWNPDREHLLRMMPEYYMALTDVSTETWLHGPLSTKEREFICIAIDCTVTHSYEPGLRAHIRNALKQGATREELLEIFQLAALLGLEGYLLGARTICDTLDEDASRADTFAEQA